MPMIPKQLAILNYLADQLRGINPTNTDPATGEAYVNDLREGVFIGRTTLGDSDPTPALAFLEAPEPLPTVAADEERVIRKESWKLLLQGFAKGDADNPTIPAYWLKAQAEERLSRLISVNQWGDPAFQSENIVGKLITAMTIGAGVVRPPAANVSPTGFFYLPLLIEMTTDLSQPYIEV